MEHPPDLTLTQENDPMPHLARSPVADVVSASSTEPPAHLEQALAAAEGTASAAAPAPQFMPRAEWCEFWLKCHGITGQVMGSSVLKSVPQRAGMLEAAGAIYDSCIDTPALHWMIAPGGKWFQRGAIVLYAYGPVVGELRAERAAVIAARARAPRVEAPRDPAGSLGETALGAVKPGE